MADPEHPIGGGGNNMWPMATDILTERWGGFYIKFKHLEGPGPCCLDPRLLMGQRGKEIALFNTALQKQFINQTGFRFDTQSDNAALN